MFHTASLRADIYHEDLYEICILTGFTDNDFYKLLNARKSIFIRRKLFVIRNEYYPGMKEITVFKSHIKHLNTFWYMVYIKIEPLEILLGRKTVELFTATGGNVSALKELFHNNMRRILKGSFPRYHDIQNWDCARLDMSHNLMLPNEEIADDFIQLSKRHDLLPYHKENFKDKTGSNSLYAKSSKVILYNKKKQIREVYSDISEREKIYLMTASTGMVRFELQCRKAKLRSIRNRYRIKDRSLFGFLDEKISDELLAEYYYKAVGFGDFYIKYHAEKKVQAANMSKSMKEKLIKALRSIALSRSVKKARYKFVSGFDKSFTGSQVTFDGYLKQLDVLGINYVMIPKEWPAQKAHYDHVDKCIVNPVPDKWRF